MDTGRRNTLQIGILATFVGLYNALAHGKAKQFNPRSGLSKLSLTSTDAHSSMLVSREQLLTGQLIVKPDQVLLQDQYTSVLVLPEDDVSDVDNGLVYQLANHKRAVRVWEGGVRPEWFGAIGDGIADDTNALRAAIVSEMNRGSVILGAGKTYRCTGPLSDGPSIIQLSGEGAVLWQSRAWPQGIDVRDKTTRLLMDYLPASPDEGFITFKNAGSRLEHIEIEFAAQRHPVPSTYNERTQGNTYDSAWKPAQTGWAVKSTAIGWHTFTDVIIRGFRKGFWLTRGDGCHFERIYLGVYDQGIQIDDAADVVRVRDIHQGIFHVPKDVASRTEVTWCLNNLAILTLGRLDNPVFGDIFGIFSHVGMKVTGRVSKASFERLEFDESIYGIVVDGGQIDASFSYMLFQRFPEGQSTQYGEYHTLTPAEGLAFYTTQATTAKNRIVVQHLNALRCVGPVCVIRGSTILIVNTLQVDDQSNSMFVAYDNAQVSNEHVVGDNNSGAVFEIHDNAIWHGIRRTEIDLTLPAIKPNQVQEVEVPCPFTPSTKSGQYSVNFEMIDNSLIDYGVLLNARLHPDGNGIIVTLRNVSSDVLSLPRANYYITISG